MIGVGKNPHGSHVHWFHFNRSRYIMEWCDRKWGEKKQLDGVLNEDENDLLPRNL